MISSGDAPRIDRNRFSLSSFVSLLEAKLLVIKNVVSSIKFYSQKEGFYDIDGFSVPAPFFLEFLEKKPDIKFEDNEKVLQVLGCEKGTGYVGIVEEYWAEGPWNKKPGTPNIVFYCHVGGNPAHRLARATYEDLYELLAFLQNKNKH